MDIFGIGLPEILLILVLAMIVFGPERLPKIARDLGSTLASFRREAEGIRQEFLSSVESVQSPMQDTINELRAALNVNAVPPRPAPMELSSPSQVSDELPSFVHNEAATSTNNVTAPVINPTTTVVPTPTASKKDALPAIAAPVTVEAGLNSRAQVAADKHNQAVAKPLPRPIVADALPPTAPPLLSQPVVPAVPAVPTIEPTSTPPQPSADLHPSLGETAPLDEPQADALFGHNPFFDETMIMSAGEAAIPIAAEVAPETEAIGTRLRGVMQWQSAAPPGCCLSAA